MFFLPTATERKAKEPAVTPSDRRAYQRLSWAGTAVIRILPYGPDVLGVLFDISEGGCGVELGIDIPAQVGTRVEVDLTVRGVRLELAGIIRNKHVVRRTERETRVGIEFMHASYASGDKVRSVIKTLL